tara:strand:- start:4913 stop:5725 length:813 start_codon:yes stop_codon:yes gene_type:complete
MSILSIQDLNDIFDSEDFKTNYDEYISKKECSQFSDFIDGIELNKKYFRLEMNKKKGYRNKHKNMSDDTIAIKEITSLLNKVSDKNILSVRQKIKDKIVGKDYLRDMILESILQKCILHTIYIDIFIDLIHYLYPHTQNIYNKIDKCSDKIYRDIQNLEIKGESDYLIMCEKNKKLDKLIGHSLLIAELEKKKIVTGKIHPVIDEFIKTLKDCDDDDNKYKCVQCLYNIFKSFYGEYILPEGYNQKLNELIGSEKTNKIKFKMMDIIERR